MKYRHLGNTDLKVSHVGLGTVEIGVPYGLGMPDPPPDEECIRLLHTALDLGITYFDTAAGYGRSEELLGKAFGSLTGDRPVIATKVKQTRGRSEAPLRGDELADYISGSVEESLRRLRLERLDLIQVYIEQNGITPDLLTAMSSLKARGLVRFWGATTYGEEQALAVAQQGEPFSSIQVAYNLLDRVLESDALPRCHEAQLAVVLRSVFLQGVLSGRAQDYPAHMSEIKEPALAAEAMARASDIGIAECAVRFATYGPARPDVTLVGTFAQKELRQNIDSVAAGPLPHELVEKLAALSMAGNDLLMPSNWGLPDAFE